MSPIHAVLSVYMEASCDDFFLTVRNMRPELQEHA